MRASPAYQSNIAVVDFLDVKLKFVVAGYSDVQANECALIIVTLLAECCEVLVSVPLCVEDIFKCLLCLHAKGAPVFVEGGLRI